MEGKGTSYNAVIVGAGFGGMYMLYKLRALGFTARVFEQGGDVGGTWYWNRYPGARCDMPSVEYSYQFSEELQQEWHWPEKFSSQPEILCYAKHVADRFDLRKDIQFHTKVLRGTWDEAVNEWIVETDHDDRVTAKFFVLATGCLSTPMTPNIPGLEDFQGQQYHTGNWPHEKVDLTGKRVGIIGTGSSGIQSIPKLAQEAEHLYVFQRTPQYSIPACNEFTNPEEEARIKASYREFRLRNHRHPFSLDMDPPTVNTFDVSEEERRRRYEDCWKKGSFHTFLVPYLDSSTNLAANLTICEFLKEKIRSIVKDPSVAALLIPENIYSCKRPCLDLNYFETFNRPNVTLVDIRRSGIERATPKGLRTNDVDYELDCIVFATGFDAMTGTLKRIDIRGRHQVALAEKWANGPRTYLGLCVAGFPNMFTITGPGSPSVLSNMIASIEQHVKWISNCFVFMRQHGKETIEATPEAEDPWVTHVKSIADATLWPTCNNWYLGANIPGKARVFTPYVDWVGYNAKCEEVVQNSYEGFSLQ